MYFLYSMTNPTPFISVNNKQEIFIATLNSGLTALGAQKGDVIKSINGEALTMQNAKQVIGQSFSWKEGDDLTFEVIRNGKTVKLEGKAIQPKVETSSLKVLELPPSDPKVILRNAWLKG